MQRRGSATQVVLIAAGLLLVVAIGFGIWWQWSYREDPVAGEVVADADRAVTTYLLKHDDPKLGNFERLTGFGYDHTHYGNPPVRALRAARTALFTNGFTGTNARLELILIILPASSDDDTTRTVVKRVEDDGRRYILTDPRLKG